MIYASLIISALYLFICSAAHADNFDGVKDRESAQVMTLGVSVLFYMLAQALNTTEFGSIAFESRVFSALVVVGLSYSILNIVETLFDKSDLYKFEHTRLLDSTMKNKEFSFK